ncbi:MAG: DUF4382 domain-containing protein [Balneolaceae bacterium]|nr:DUF4382 domain-containing protein [Balneolaceae bacterium]
MKDLSTTSPLRTLMNSILALALLLVVGYSCSDTLTGGMEEGKGRIDIRLTDAPGDYQQVNIDVQGLRIRHLPPDSDATEEDSSENEQWIDLEMEPMTVDLLKLQNGVDTLLASADLEPGRYTELRLLLGSDNTVMVNSSLRDLKVPSGQQSGYKVRFDTQLDEGENLELVVDFDAGQSVVKAGNSGMYLLKPVLKAFVENGGDSDTGSLAGQVEPVEAHPNIFAIMEDDTSSTQPDSTGSFLFRGLDAGTYRLSIEPTGDAWADTTITDIEVEEGEETDLGTVTLSGN